MGATKTLAILHIYTCLTQPSLCRTAISTKIKYAGLFDLFFTLNPANLDMLKIQIDDNYRGRHEVFHMWAELLRLR